MNQKAASAIADARRVHSVDHEVLSALIETKAINFEAVGQVISRVGASSIFIDDGWIRWCGSDLSIWRWPGPRLGLDTIPNIRDQLRGIAGLR